MSVFLAVTLVVCAVVLIAGAAVYFRAGSALRSLGRQGGTWFENPQERELQDLPNEDERDAPIPRRPLRVRSR